MGCKRTVFNNFVRKAPFVRLKVLDNDKKAVSKIPFSKAESV
jgi:hypothetical protein